jgi:hypothetical protein
LWADLTSLVLSGCAVEELLVCVEDVEDVAPAPLGFVAGYAYWAEDTLEMLLIIICRLIV